MARITLGDWKQAVIKRARDLDDSIRNDLYRERMVDFRNDSRVREYRALVGIAWLYGVDLKLEIRRLG